MPERMQSALRLFAYRFSYNFFLAVIVGVSGNVFVHFTFKIDTSEFGRFSLENMEAYTMALYAMFSDVTRFKVSQSACLLYTLMMSLPVHYLKEKLIRELYEYAGIDSEVVPMVIKIRRLPYRILYWISTAIERLLIAWVVYITFLAHNPHEPVSWLKFMQNVRSPIRIFSNQDNVIGFAVFLLSISVLASVFSLAIRQHHRRLGYRGGVLRR